MDEQGLRRALGCRRARRSSTRRYAPPERSVWLTRRSCRRFLRVAQSVEFPCPPLGDHSNGDSTRLSDKPLSESHTLPECTTCARSATVPGHSSSDASSTLVLTTRGLSWTNSEISS